MKRTLFIIRAEADFERAVCLAISSKPKCDNYFVFVGDSSIYFKDGIKNKFQKAIFKENGFYAQDVFEFSLIGRLLKKISKGISLNTNQVRQNKFYFPFWILHLLLQFYTNKNKLKLVKSVLATIRPNIIFTDQSGTNPDYFPEIFRKEAIAKKLPVYIYTHGAAGGLHCFFSEQKFDKYEGCTVFCCSKYEDKSDSKNRIILGDISSSAPYVNFMNKKNIDDIQFMDDCKYKVGLMVGGIGPLTSTNAWHVMEEIIIEYSDKNDVAMVLKLHPRMINYDLRIIETFKNLLIVNRETDRSRLSKWADIVICSDHCSTIFEPMILRKKVVAIQGKHIPKYKNSHSPLKSSSILHISNSDELDFDNIPNANSEDPIMDTVAWGGNGKIDLAKLVLNKINL